METDATGHGTQDTGRDPRPALRAPTPDLRPADVLRPENAPDDNTDRRTQDTSQDTVPRDIPHKRKDSRVSRWVERHAASRAGRARSAEQQKMLEDASRAARDAERDAERDAMSRAAASRRAVSRGRTTEQPDAKIAPIPKWMRIAGVWLDRTFGATPLLAPLVVSGYFTMHVFTDAPLNAPWGIALFITLALEGGVWKLSRIYEKTLLEGDSTIGIRMVIGFYLLLISGMIYGHAYYLAWNDAKAAGNADASQLVADWSKWAPAAGVAVMSLLGVMVWSKQARYLHRVKLREQGQVDPRAPKFATLAWVLTPRETFGALRHSVKYRISSPVDAVDDRRLYRAAGRPPIWPIPPGFAWTNGTLVQTDPLAGRDVQDTVPLESASRPALDAGQNGTPARVINGTSREVVPQLTTGHHGTQDTAGTAGRNGTPQDTDVPQNPAGDGTRDDDGTRDGDEFAEILKYTEHLIAVVETFPDWHAGSPPSVRKITAAVDRYRKRKDGGSYNSNATSAKVQEALVKLRERPQLLDVMRVQQEGSEE